MWIVITMKGMRVARFKVPSDREVGFYHCVSRVVDRQFHFQEVHKERFVSLMREYEEFCEVRVLTFCIMSNHFHILVEVPRPPEVKPDAETILRKLRRLTGCQDPGLAELELKGIRERKDHAAEQAWLGRFYARMWDISAFMKLLKQRFTQWFNGVKDRCGTLWESRFHSVLVEGSGEALMTMAAYIDLNPVRAKVVSDPKDYRWSGYGEAVAGRRLSKLALQRLIMKFTGKEQGLADSLAAYRLRVFHQGHESNETVLEDGQTSRGALKHEEVLKVLNERGRLPLSDYLRCRVRYFCAGAVIGSQEFVNGIFAAYKERFDPKRVSGARRVRGLQAELYVLRDLQVDVFG